MSIGSIFRRLLVLLAICHSFSATAAEPAGSPASSPDRGWDCWVSTDLKDVAVSYLIRCIRDRETKPADPPADSLPALLLDIVHENIHRGKAIEIDLDLATGRLAEASPYIQQIRIHQYPYTESWGQERPQQLVRAVLCKTDPDCPVLLSQ
jgi:hypothetical protein